MERATLQSLHFSGRNEAMTFLKRLWHREPTDCPVCGTPLEMLHRKAKQSDCDWQCRQCGIVFRTMHLLDELNRQMPE